MSTDYPDYTLPIVVIGTVTVTGAVTVSGTVAISGTVTVTGAVTVTGSVTVSGTVAISGTVTVTGSVTVSGTVAISGSVAVTGTVAVSGTVTVTGTVAVSGTVTVAGAVTVSGTVAVSGTVTVSGTVAVSGTVTVTGSVTVSGTVAVSGTVTVTGSVTISGTVAVSGTVTITGSVTVSNTVTVTGSVTVSGTVAVSGTVTVTGSVTVSGTVSISGSVTVTGAVTISGPVSVATVAADNIIIDKLTVGAYTERRSTIANNGVTEGWGNCSGGVSRGKFFSCGCRGFINTIDLYCKDNGAAGGTVTVYLSPYIGAGVVYSATVTIPAAGAAAWRSATFNKMWTNASLFIFVYGSTSDMVVGYDTGSPPDYFLSENSGATWTGGSYRYDFRAIMMGETCGDVPISGTVNNMEIPNIAGARQATQLTIPPLSEVYDTIRYGTGKLLICIFHALGSGVRSSLWPRIRIDGIQILPWDTFMKNWEYYIISSNSLGICLGKWDETNDIYTIMVMVPYPFKRTLEIGYYNQHAVTTFQPYVAYNYEVIS